MKPKLGRLVGITLMAAVCLDAVVGTVLAQGFGGFGGFGGGTTGRRTGSSSGNYPSSTEVGTASFSTDPETRKLVVVTDDETAQYISMVVSNLDRPAPQVLIKVVFLEVTHRDGSDIGVQGRYVRNLNDTGVGTLAQNFTGLPGITSGEGLFTVIGDDFAVTLRAIAEAGKLEVLSRPSVLARNNQEAMITVGQQVPLITGVTYDTFGNQRNAIAYQDVGIILRVTPFITSDGMVEMVVAPEISNLSDETVAIATGTNAVGAPVINTRSADTVVITPNGQTVVIGGLMQTTKTEAVSKIPLLGDIPLLGAAFRRKVKEDTKTELLIFLTPHIVQRPDELAAMSSKEKAGATMAPRAFGEEELNRFLESVTQQENGSKKKKKK
jgi:general secretion pathway protein D